MENLKVGKVLRHNLAFLGVKETPSAIYYVYFENRIVNGREINQED